MPIYIMHISFTSVFAFLLYKTLVMSLGLKEEHCFLIWVLSLDCIARQIQQGGVIQP